MRTSCLAFLLTSFLAGQGPPSRVIVTTRAPGNPATQLLAVDLATGSFTVLPRFPADVLPPLAIAFDPYDGELLLAQDAGGGISRVFRYTMAGGVPGNERAMGDVPGHVVELGFAGEDIVAATDGLQGGTWHLPRGGGPVVQGFSQPHLGAMQTFGVGSFGTIAWSGSQTPPVSDPGVAIADLITGQSGLGPETFPGFAHPGITGVMDLQTSVPRQLLSHTDGAVSMHTMFTSSLPVVLAVQPPAPAGGAVALKPRVPNGNTPLVLGGVAFPNLWTFDPSAATPVRTLIAGPLPGDPVDFAATRLLDGEVLFFGSACGVPSMAMSTTGLPQPGNNTFQIGLLAAVANAAALFVAGFSDQLGGALPFTLPSGCLLLVSPDAVLFHLTSPTGSAAQIVPVPNQPGLVGLHWFAQWLQAPALPFATSGAIAIRIGQ